MSACFCGCIPADGPHGTALRLPLSRNLVLYLHIASVPASSVGDPELPQLLWWSTSCRWSLAPVVSTRGLQLPGSRLFGPPSPSVYESFQAPGWHERGHSISPQTHPPVRPRQEHSAECRHLVGSKSGWTYVNSKTEILQAVTRLAA